MREVGIRLVVKNHNILVYTRPVFIHHSCRNFDISSIQCVGYFFLGACEDIEGWRPRSDIRLQARGSMMQVACFNSGWEHQANLIRKRHDSNYIDFE